jgi:hypothetical protein
MGCGKATSVNLKLYLAQAQLLGDGGGGMASPALQRLLAASRRQTIDLPLPAVLCSEFGLEAEAGWPLAALSWLGEGNDPGQSFWLQADPVHLALQRDYFSLSHPAPLALSRPHAETLTAELNRHFAADGLQFHLGRERADGARWYLRLPGTPDLHTSLPQQVVGQDIRPFLPQGQDAATWQRLANEIQMLLHDHPVNQAREAAGQLPVNSLWFSGGGVLPRMQSSAAIQVFSDLPLAMGLAQASGAQHAPLPQDAAAWIADARGQTSLLVLAATDRTEQDWFVPLLRALRERKLARLELHLEMGGHTLSARLRWFDLLLRPWHRPRSLSAYFAT